MMTPGARGEAGAGADVLESTRMVSMLLYLYKNGESRRSGGTTASPTSWTS